MEATTKEGVVKETCLIKYCGHVHFMKKGKKQGKKDNPPSQFHETKARKQGKKDIPQNKKG